MSDLMLLYDYYMGEAEATYFYEDMRMFEQLARSIAKMIKELGEEDEDF